MRLDKVLVARQLISSRQRARDLIVSGKVSVDGKTVLKPSFDVPEKSMVALAEQDFPWVSRGGLKLEKAINEFGIEVKNKNCLDIGACTGGFTDVLLHFGAQKVYALDVGHGQLADKLRSDPKVINLEGQNIRTITNDVFAEKIDLIVIDVSFISLEHVLPVAANIIWKRGSIIALIKPHFEVGKENIGKGFVTDEALHQQVIQKIRTLGSSLGLHEKGLTIAPIVERKNKEFLIYYSK